jgi:hypothetical protein
MPGVGRRMHGRNAEMQKCKNATISEMGITSIFAAIVYFQNKFNAIR